MNLDRAKELRDKCARNIGDYCDDCKQEAKQLKEKVEKEMKERVTEIWKLDSVNKMVNSLTDKDTEIIETLKILNEILGEKE